MSGSGPAGTSLASHLSFNPDLPLADQVVALATLTAAGDQPCATSLLAALPNQAEVTRIGAEALVVWAHRLYAGPGYGACQIFCVSRGSRCPFVILLWIVSGVRVRRGRGRGT